MSSATYVITGAAGALGSTLARRIIARGDSVAAVDTPRAADRLRGLRGELGERCLPFTIDVGSSSDWKETLARIDQELGPPQGAALIAGGWKGGKPFVEFDEAAVADLFAVNLQTAERSLRALLPGMIQRGAGSVVVVGSRAVERPWTSAGAAVYAASKAAVVSLAQAIAAEVLEQGVRINAVLPSTLDTPANRAAMPDVDPSRWVSLDSLSQVIGFLLSDGAKDISGAAIPVYGRA